ncbi:mannose-1-phosphate guanyltransferase [Salmonella enterica subsp. enterica]|uniref:Mannose-1-phosphate guanyltransferase n=1 Tax=Salmonella enterica I TaxID=59201 RepID=A0A379VQU6_SALET|nr:mannose-1-phosphate guanyltransferase [Salmonella enterica subsp. enterica]
MLKNTPANGKLVTFGIVPTHAETGYGYIRRGELIGNDAYAVAEFVEKPDIDTAGDYSNQGNITGIAYVFISCKLLL